MRKLKTFIQTVIVIVILFTLVSPMLITYANNISIKEEKIITVEEVTNNIEEEKQKKEKDLVLTAGAANILEKDIPYDKIPKRNISLINIGEYRLTAYCGCEKCCGQWSKYNLTASGTTPQQGRTVACNSLEFGTELVINGNKYVVEDRGGMKGNTIDIYFNSHEAALAFGVQYAKVLKFE